MIIYTVLIISGSGNASTVCCNFTIIKALNEWILHNNIRIYNIIMSTLTSLSGYDILVQLGGEIMTVYRMTFLCVILMSGCDILMSAYVFARQDIATLF